MITLVTRYCERSLCHFIHIEMYCFVWDNKDRLNTFSPNPKSRLWCSYVQGTSKIVIGSKYVNIIIYWTLTWLKNNYWRHINILQTGIKTNSAKTRRVSSTIPNVISEASHDKTNSPILSKLCWRVKFDQLVWCIHYWLISVNNYQHIIHADMVWHYTISISNYASNTASKPTTFTTGLFRQPLSLILL